MGFEVKNRYLFKAYISSFFQSRFRIYIPLFNVFTTRFNTSLCKFISLSFVFFAFLLYYSDRFSAIYKSFWINSCLIIFISRTGSIPPSVCDTFSFLNALTTWYKASTCVICDKNSFPNPNPSEAPFTKPAISTILRIGPTSFYGENNVQSY